MVCFRIQHPFLNMVNADNAQQTITTFSQGIHQQCRRKRFHGDRFLINFRSQGMLSRCPSTNPMHVKFEAPTICRAVLGNKTWSRTLISGFYPVLPSRKEVSGEIIVQLLGSKMSISSNWASKRVIIGAFQRGLWMEAVPTVSCHQEASCPMLLWFFPESWWRPFQ